MTISSSVTCVKLHPTQYKTTFPVYTNRITLVTITVSVETRTRERPLEKSMSYNNGGDEQFSHKKYRNQNASMYKLLTYIFIHYSYFVYMNAC